MKTALKARPEKQQKDQSKTHLQNQKSSSVETQQPLDELASLNPFSDWEDNPFDPKDLEEINSAPREQEKDEDLTENSVEPPPKNYLLTPQVGISLLAIFGCIYVLTRPCVIGECQVIDTAKQLGQV